MFGDDAHDASHDGSGPRPAQQNAGKQAAVVAGHVTCRRYKLSLELRPTVYTSSGARDAEEMVMAVRIGSMFVMLQTFPRIEPTCPSLPKTLLRIPQLLSLRLVNSPPLKLGSFG